MAQFLKPMNIERDGEVVAKEQIRNSIDTGNWIWQSHISVLDVL